MKKRILSISLAIIAIVGITTISGCKKGENDPFLSLKSRKARITGEWKLSSGTITETGSNGGLTSTDVTLYTGSTVSSDGNTSTYSEILTIEKDGTFELAIVEDGDPFTIRGNWFFSGKNEDADLKKKEAVIFSELEYIYSNGVSKYTGLYADQIMIIDQLKNKEMIFKGTITYSDSDGNSGSYAYDRTFEKN
jgi:hypothetical protein|tara:strand:+ start:12690 stop:13268 length:579 start_codon:yes stop_codon:yes gene_type:complete